MAAHLVVTLTNVPLAMLFYELFKVVSHRAVLLIAFFTLLATAVEGASLFSQNSHSIPTVYDVYTAFFAFYAVTIGYLILSSPLMPPPIGALMLIDGIAYLTYAFADFLAPGFASHLIPWIQVPILAGEGSLCLWLLIAGVDARRWSEGARSAREVSFLN